MPKPRKLLAIAASVGKVGFVYLVDGELMDWGVSRKASENIDNAFRSTTMWVLKYRPDLIIVEHVNGNGRKGQHSKSLVEALKATARERGVEVIVVKRPMEYASKYHEARALAAEFPQIEPWLPDQRDPWETEPANIILFEALSLAATWLRQQAGEANNT